VFENISKINEREDNIFIVKSTVTPGTVEALIKAYPNLDIIHSPEFLTERNARLDFINAPRIILGGEENLLDETEKLFRSRFPYIKIIKTDVTSAQFIKYMANCFFATKVSFMNEMKQAADKLGVKWDDAMHGFISDGRIGNSHLDVPGHDGSLGFGGKCFPKDLNAFIGLFEELGVEPKVMRAAWQKNLEVRNNHDWREIEGAVSK
jgi:UDPglucose 6-dehydrogenase